MDRYICFVGDLVAGGCLLDDDPEDIVQSQTFREAELRIANLEHPIGTGEPIPQKSTLYAPPEAVDYLTAMNINAVSLANNHVQDLGPERIEETIDLLESAGIGSFGAGCTIKEASEPYHVTEELVILGYCAFDSPSLNKIQIATVDSPGVNPLTHEKVERDLQQLEPNTEAILYIHWGIENTWFPPSDVVDLAEKLLDHPGVAGIVGTHPHRTQGHTTFGSKRAYFSIGNFLFPDLILEPPVSVSYSQSQIEPRYETKRYHPVTKSAKKTWTRGARISLLISYCIEDKQFQHTPMYQSEEPLQVQELTGRPESLVHRWIWLSSYIANGPRLLNQIALSTNLAIYKLWNILGIMMFLYRQNGARWLLNFLRVGILSKLKPGVDPNERLYEFFND